MRPLAPLLGIAVGLAACGRSPAEGSSKATTPVASPSTSTSTDVPGASGDPTAMAGDLEELTAFLDVAVRSCQRSAAHAEAVAKLRQAQASSYADRDELAIRVDRKDFGDRDLRAWHREIKQRKAAANGVASGCPKP